MCIRAENLNYRKLMSKSFKIVKYLSYCIGFITNFVIFTMRTKKILLVSYLLGFCLIFLVFFIILLF